jgi:DnaJ-class molecular chaperone
MSQRDYYEILGVSKTATADEVRAAHRRLVRKLHPDVNTKDPNASKRFQEVQEAYDTLSDPEKRKQYDQFGHAGPQPFTNAGNPYSAYSTGGGRGYDPNVHVEEIDPTDFGGGAAGSGQFGDIFDQLFGQRGPFGRGRRGRAGSSQAPVDYEAGGQEVEYPVRLSFVQAARGTTLPITINRGTRSETIDIKIPAGVKTGSRVRIKGKGAIGPNGPSDLFVVAQVDDHAYFRRDGLDVLLDVPITVFEALLGTTVNVPTLDGRMTITIPPRTNSGAKLRIKGAGAHRGADKGDQLCIIKVLMPKELDTTDVAAIEMVRQKRTFDPRSDVGW